MRSYDEELCVLNRRANWRRFNDFGEPGEVMYLPFIRQRIYAGKEVPRCLLVADDDIAAKHVSKMGKTTKSGQRAVRCQGTGSEKIQRRRTSTEISGCGKSSHLVASASHVTLMIL